VRFVPTSVAGALIVEVDAHADMRGTFARTFCSEIFADHGLVSTFVQCNVSTNRKRGTLRGLHYQQAPGAETKLVRATRGKVFDVAVDLRPQSATYRHWASVELDSDRHNAFYIPAGCAHGFLTLEDDCELFYQMSEPHAPGLSRGVRWDDPQFAIKWPFEPLVISDRDAALPSHEGPAT
jgi:dTDP-4-dehydrorhamnose 3,5-epimerase